MELLVFLEFVYGFLEVGLALALLGFGFGPDVVEVAEERRDRLVLLVGPAVQTLCFEVVFFKGGQLQFYLFFNLAHVVWFKSLGQPLMMLFKPIVCELCCNQLGLC